MHVWGHSTIAVAALYIRMGLCKLCYAFRSSVLELAFSTAEAEIGSFSKAKRYLEHESTRFTISIIIGQQATAVIAKL